MLMQIRLAKQELGKCYHTATKPVAGTYLLTISLGVTLEKDMYRWKTKNSGGGKNNGKSKNSKNYT